MLAALLWDVDGTLAETERDGHRVAFNAAFAAEGLPWVWGVDEYAGLLRITGGFERLLAYLSTRADAPASAKECASLARHLHAIKNRHYADYVRTGRVPLRPGVAALLDEAHAQGVRLAVVTTTSRSNVAALLESTRGAVGAAQFETWVTGEDVTLKKPHPEAYEVALARLQLAPSEVLALEDSAPGAAAAVAAGVPVVVARSVYFAEDAIDGALAMGPTLGSIEGWSRPAPADASRVDLRTLRAWHAHREPPVNR